MKHDALTGQAASLGVRLEPAAVEQLVLFERLLIDRAIPAGSVGPADAASIRERHVLDCLRAAPQLAAGNAADLGSGAGLPGLVVAIARPDVSVDLLEPQRRRLAFLELAVERLRLPNAEPVGRRAQQVAGPYQTVLARAFADARASWRVAERLLAPGGSLVYFAGATFRRDGLGDLRIDARIVPAPALLASAGPLVIMTRQ